MAASSTLETESQYFGKLCGNRKCPDCIHPRDRTFLGVGGGVVSKANNIYEMYEA